LASVLCEEGNLLAQQKSKSWSLGFTFVFGSRLLALNSKLKVPMVQQANGIESSAASMSLEVLALSELGCSLPGFTAAALVMKEQNLWAARVLGLACLLWASSSPV
jgi:hypothetical protein